MLKALKSSGLIHKVGVITLVLSAGHLLEDMILVMVGRYTTIEIWMILLGTIGFSFIVGLVSRVPRVKRFLGG
jgi:hypothetical protein|tara:strand:+ start:1175 stop:1393 length:219 start_codon:yes stop_codon:yes gene_type:complete